MPAGNLKAPLLASGTGMPVSHPTRRDLLLSAAASLVVLVPRRRSA